MNNTLSSLVNKLTCLAASETAVIPWSCPVPSFGNLSRSRVATVGLNPSNREFVDVFGNELDGSFRRFHTLRSLGLASWSEADSKHLELIIESCRAYFLRNPYEGWFRQLDHIISGTKSSYYDARNMACHLDLIPYATACKWTGLSYFQRSSLLNAVGDTLGCLLNDSPIRMLVLNGKSVVEEFQNMASVRLDTRVMPSWALCRGSKPAVTGYAFSGVVCELNGVKLNREILALGFNHNIQSSFGVTSQVRAAIRAWIGREAEHAAA
jgi:hypothetical protein